MRARRRRRRQPSKMQRHQKQTRLPTMPILNPARRLRKRRTLSRNRQALRITEEPRHSQRFAGPQSESLRFGTRQQQEGFPAVPADALLQGRPRRHSESGRQPPAGGRASTHRPAASASSPSRPVPWQVSGSEIYARPRQPMTDSAGRIVADRSPAPFRPAPSAPAMSPTPVPHQPAARSTAD